jgi:3'-phosphoadenosine 5'-phosphosulfate sulfotransferase (PAPS reductase)/FAD synthetase
MPKRQYLSFGAGVNSTALLLLLTDRGEDFETVFVNHGGDYPETYEYVDYLRAEGFEITEVIPPAYCGCTTIEQYIYKYKFIPAGFGRWCTQHFKVIPFLKHIKAPCTALIGFGYDEKHRAERRIKKHKLEENVTYEYPLIEAGLNRDDCAQLIVEHGLKTPERSTCWFCPLQNKQQLRQLYLKNHKLYRRAVEIENLCSGGGKHFMKSKPLPAVVMEGTPALTSFLD